MRRFHFELDPLRLGGDGTIHVMFEHRLQLGATLLDPLAPGGDLSAVEEDERVREANVRGQWIPLDPIMADKPAGWQAPNPIIRKAFPINRADGFDPSAEYLDGLGALPLLIPLDAPTGTTYEVRLFSNDSLTRLATSNPFSVS